MSSQLLVDTHGACELLAISPRSLWQLTKDGAIPCRRLGRSVRYSIRDLEAWIAAGCPRNEKAVTAEELFEMRDRAEPS
jgi:excisionase family DNA binding protein